MRTLNLMSIHSTLFPRNCIEVKWIPLWFLTLISSSSSSPSHLFWSISLGTGLVSRFSADHNETAKKSKITKLLENIQHLRILLLWWRFQWISTYANRPPWFICRSAAVQMLRTLGEWGNLWISSFWKTTRKLADLQWKNLWCLPKFDGPLVYSQ